MRIPTKHVFCMLLTAAILAATVATSAIAQPAEQTMARREKAYPTGDKATSVLLLERLAPVEIRLGQPLAYTVKVTNLTGIEVQDVVLTEQLPAGFRVETIEPKPTSTEESLATWKWEKLGAREAKTIEIKGKTDRLEQIEYCATVTFKTVFCSSTRVVQPELALTKTAPEQVLLCDPIPLRFVVSNNGTGAARNVRVTDTLPDGWSTAEGRNALVFEAGDLAAGQAREFTASVQASRTGQFVNTARAAEDGGLTAEATATTVVRKPVLAVSKTGPDFRYVGRPAKFEITVRNDGDAPATQTVLVDALPAGTKFVAASAGGKAANGQVTWNLGTLAPGDVETVQLTLTPTQIGTVRNTVTVKAVCAEAAGAATMEVRGIPAVLLEVIDIEDPIELGSNETYEIAILNQGSAADTNTTIVCTLPPEQQYVSSSGPTEATVDGKMVRFAPLASLAPKAKVTYRVVVKGVKTGDVRFAVSMTTDQTKTPVQETESTHIYE
ncbi:MAG TPA: NEW3 domain-containing protein [Phycisphaerae bacterium]|nr:NEW3 domain-containing protein [Phycisphaerae bacterium]